MEGRQFFVVLWHGNTPFKTYQTFLIRYYPVLVDWTRHLGCTIQGKPNKYQTIASMNIKICYRGENP